MSRRSLFAYSLTELPITMSLFPVIVFIPKFYTSDMGIPLVLAANIILAVRLFDVVTDPLVGYLSDRTGGRFGRRRPWIAAATPVMMLIPYYAWAAELSPDYNERSRTTGWRSVLGAVAVDVLYPGRCRDMEISNHRIRA